MAKLERTLNGEFDHIPNERQSFRYWKDDM